MYLLALAPNVVFVGVHLLEGAREVLGNEADLELCGGSGLGWGLG